ncbi:MAG: DUF378 domain-containing protein [Patescibacteria group bacterium]
MKGNKGIHMVAFTLLLVGGLNWLVFALTGWDIGQIFGGMETTVSKVIYVLVGLSAVYELLVHKADCRLCNPSGM